MRIVTYYILLTWITMCMAVQGHAQTYVFAQLSGTPISTAGWNLQGYASVGNVIQTGNSEVIVCPISSFGSGAVFYNQPINLSVCSKWIAEFDFRIYDGSMADGLAFCFLDVPPTGFVTGGGMGIPVSANGLKICFDPNPNCAPYSTTNMPKIEMRWGVGYDECWAQPTIDNTTGTLNFVRSATYNHAKITYDNGTMNVYVNNTLYLTGFQQFNFSGYLGFTAATGGRTDNHSIKNVIIYTDMPPSEAGTNASICSGANTQLGTTPNASYTYTWSPATGLSSATIANPVATLTNTSTSAVSQKYYVQTSFASNTGCTSIDSVLVTVNPGSSLSIAASQTTVCTGTNVVFTATPVNPGAAPVYQWKLNGNVVGNNSATYANNTLSNGDVISCVMTGTVTCVTAATSNNVTMTVNSASSAVAITSSATTICSGTNVTFTATPTNGGTTPVYQWKKNGTNTGTNSTTYSSNTLANGDVITCVLTSSITCTAPVTSNSINITVNPVATASITIATPATAICTGTGATFTATPTNGGTTPVYQWKKNGANTGTNNATYTDNALNNNDIITCVLTSNAVCVTTTVVTSNAVTITVNPVITASVAITASATTFCSGTNITFTATPANGGTTPVYQWKKNGNNVGANSATYTDNTLANNDVVSCVLTSSLPCTANATSNSISVTVNPLTIASITIAATATTICSGTNVTFTATATNGGTTPIYQWKKNGNNVGANSATYTDNTLLNNDVISCVLTSSIICTANATSNSVSITVNPIVTASVAITATATTFCNGTNVTFTATPANGGTTPVYQWKLNGNNTGANSAAYSNSTLITGDMVSCILTSSIPCTANATSNNVGVTVIPATTASVAIAASATTICTGTTVIFTATPTNGGTTPVYQWKKNGTNKGTNSATYSDNTLTNGDVITCVLTSSIACTTPVTSNNSITVTVNAYTTPAITITASQTTVCAGTAVTFIATPANAGTTPVYQWQKNGNSIGANSASYTDNTLATGDTITCVVTSGAACNTVLSATSNSITITVTPNLTPSIAITASPAAVCVGDVMTFVATITNGGSSPSYQWQLNNSNIPGASATYSNNTLANGDAVNCILTSNETCVTARTTNSNTIAVIVNPSPVVSAGEDKIIHEGTSVVMDATATGNIAGFLWSPPAALDNPAILNPVATPLFTTTYSLTATSVDGCSATDDVTITVLKKLYIPNVFSPNKDGINDTWQLPYLKDYPGCTVQIFNRYGQQVFYSAGYNTPWDGTMNNQPLPVATYYYIINPKNDTPVINGAVTILR